MSGDTLAAAPTPARGLDGRGTITSRTTLPPALLPGGATKLTLTIINGGDEAWTVAGDTPILLTQVWTATDSTPIARDVGRMPLPADADGQFQAGASATLEVPVTAPTQPGTYRLTITARQRHGFWLDKHGLQPLVRTVRVVTADEYVQGAVRILHAVDRLPIGASTIVDIEVENRGSWVWPSRVGHRVHATYRWLDSEGRQTGGRGMKTDLSADVAGGERLALGLAVEAPVTPGRYRLEATLIQRDMLWFNQSAAVTLDRHEIEVVDPALLAPEDAAALDAEQARERDRRRRDWMTRHHRLTADELATCRTLPALWPAQPRVTIVTWLNDAEDAAAATATEASLLAQSYEHWRWRRLVRPGVAVEPSAVAQDRVHPGVESTIDALGYHGDDLLLFLRPGDRLAPHALTFVAGEFARDPALVWAFWDSEGEHWLADAADLRLLTPYDPDVSRRSGWLVRTGAVRCSALDPAAKLFATHATAERQLSAALDASGAGAASYHLPSILHIRGDRHDHDREAPPAHRAISGDRPRVTIVIATRDRTELLRACIRSIRRHTAYPDYEIVVMDNGSVEPTTLAYLAALAESGIARVERDEAPFSWSALNNQGARIGNGELVLFLNNDVAVTTADWLDRMVDALAEPGVGVVGATLWYGDNRLQHNGVVLDPRATGTHRLKNWPRFRPLSAEVTVGRTVAAATGACLLLRRATLDAVGGIEERYLPVGLSDIDLCLKVRERLGLRTVVVADAGVFHRESATRGVRADPAAEEAVEQQRALARLYLRNTWYEVLARDPCASPLRSAIDDCWSLSDRPGLPARLRIHRLREADRPRLAFVHVPKSGGISLRAQFEAALPVNGVAVLSARSLLQCYSGDPAALARTRAQVTEAAALYSHFSAGIGALIDVPCAYATVVRDPVARVLSQFGHLRRAEASPLAQPAFAELTIEEALRSGLVANNLTSRKILGEAPEPMTWEAIVAAGRATGANFSGFRVPRAGWLGDRDRALDPAAAELVFPDPQEVIDRLERSFFFASTLEGLGGALEPLAAVAGWRLGALTRLNEAPERASTVAPPLRALIEELNACDLAVYDWLRTRAEGVWMRPDLIAPGAGEAWT